MFFGVNKGKFIFKADTNSAISLYVAPADALPAGSDSNSGTIDSPFLTIDKARLAIRQIRATADFNGATVYLRGGTYFRTSTFELSSQDSGTVGAPIIYRAYENQKPIISGAKEISGFTSVVDPSILNRLDNNAQSNVVQVDLNAQGVTNFGQLQMRSFGTTFNDASLASIELFFNNKRMTLSQYPNVGATPKWVNIASTPDYPLNIISATNTNPIIITTEKQHGLTNQDTVTIIDLGNIPHLNYNNAAITVLSDTTFSITGKIGDRDYPSGGKVYLANRFTYIDDRPSQWAGNLEDVWMYGHWFYDWADSHQKISSIDTVKKEIVTIGQEPYGYKAGQWYYYQNILEELDQPNEWYLDRTSGILYFWPPSPVNAGKTTVSVLPNYLFDGKQVSNIKLQGLSFEGVRGNGLRITGDNNLINNCDVYNIGSDAISISGNSNGVINSRIHDIGDSAVIVTGGDRQTLTPGNNYISDNEINAIGQWSSMARIGITLNGVSNTASHNYIHDLPHIAILFNGNDHIIEYNKIENVVTEAKDAGAIYGGRDWSGRGTMIRYNYFKNITGLNGNGCNGVYLDDALSGNTIFGNIFYLVKSADFGGGSAFIGGGRDNTIENNIFVESGNAVHVDARGMSRESGSMHINQGPGDPIQDGVMVVNLKKVPYQTPPWSTKYPSLVNILNDNPEQPKGNIITRNINWKGSWAYIESVALPFLQIEDNFGTEDLLLQQNPLFMSEANEDFRLQPNSPALALGFQQIDLSTVGPRAEASPTTIVITPPQLTLSSSNFSAGWNMISFPDLSNAISSGDLLPGTYQIRKYDGASNSYLSNNITLTPGTGYWIKVDDVNSVNGKKYALNQTTSSEIAVTKGWNLLGNPFQTELPYSNLQVKYKDGSTKSYAEAITRKEVSGYAWSWEASDQKYYFIAMTPDKYKTASPKSTVIKPFRGFWMIVKSDTISSIVMNK